MFPVRTPDKDGQGWLGPLSDLLEEEITLPGESRRHSLEIEGKEGAAGARDRKSWPYLPKR